MRRFVFLLVVLPLVADAQPRRTVDTVEARRVRMPRDLETIGVVAYDVDRHAAVYPPVDARVLRVRVAAGDTVRAGAVLAELRGGRVRAPLAGTVVGRTIDPGQVVSRATPAFTVANLDRLWSYVRLDARDLVAVWHGQRVELRSDAAPGRTFTGRLARLDDHADLAGTIMVRLEIDNAQRLLRPGRLARVRLVGDRARYAVEAVAVPASAVVKVGGRAHVMVRGASGRFEPRAVETGVSGGGLVEIKGGLSEGDVVAVDGNRLLRS